jgi:hypothetical protein
MFAEFTLNNGKAIRVDATAVLAVEQLDSGCRIHVGHAAFDVKESAEAVVAELEEDEDED